jgi:hypothetical protein
MAFSVPAANSSASADNEAEVEAAPSIDPRSSPGLVGGVVAVVGVALLVALASVAGLAMKKRGPFRRQNVYTVFFNSGQPSATPSIPGPLRPMALSVR